MTTGRINQVCNDHSNPTCQPGKAWTDHLWTVVFSTNTLAMRVMFKELFASPQQPTLLMNYIAMCKSTFKAKPTFRPCLQAPIKRSTRHYIYALTLPQTHPVIKQCNNIQPAKHHSQCTFFDMIVIQASITLIFALLFHKHPSFPCCLIYVCFESTSRACTTEQWPHRFYLLIHRLSEHILWQ